MNRVEKALISEVYLIFFALFELIGNRFQIIYECQKFRITRYRIIFVCQNDIFHILFHSQVH